VRRNKSSAGSRRAGIVAFYVDAWRIEPVSARISSGEQRAPKAARMVGSVPQLALLVLTLLPTCAPAAAPEPVAAVWKEHQLSFYYTSFAAAYPCHVLRSRIARVLNAVGARPDLHVTLTDCDSPVVEPTVADGDGTGWPQNRPGSWPGDPSSVSTRDGTSWPQSRSTSMYGAYRRSEPQQVVDVRVHLSMPTEMTPEVIAELKADRKRRELITRVTGDPLPLFDDPIVFTAQRQVVTLSHETTGLERADCELLDQMATTVFRTLGVRVLRRGYVCDRSWVSRIYPALDVEALLPVPSKLAGGVQPGGSGSNKPGSTESEDPGEAPARDEADSKPE
jgi:hypothetical protein